MLKSNLFDINYLAESQEFEMFFKIVRDLTGIATALTKPDGTLAKRLCQESEYNPICQLILATNEGRTLCYSTNQQYCKQIMKCKHGIHYLCHAGLIDFAIPIYIQGKHLATINCGQLLSEQPSEKGFKKLYANLKDIPIDIKELRKAYFSANYANSNKIEVIQALLSFFAEYFGEMGYRLHTTRYVNFSDPVLELQNFIKENFSDSITLNDAATMVGLSPAYLSRLFSKHTGVHFVEYLNNLRIDQATKLLIKTDWPITRIAMEVGFNSLSYFNQVFKLLQNCSPQQYRKKTRTYNIFRTLKSR